MEFSGDIVRIVAETLNDRGLVNPESGILLAWPVFFSNIHPDIQLRTRLDKLDGVDSSTTFLRELERWSAYAFGKRLDLSESDTVLMFPPLSPWQVQVELFELSEMLETGLADYKNRHEEPPPN